MVIFITTVIISYKKFGYVGLIVGKVGMVSFPDKLLNCKVSSVYGVFSAFYVCLC